MIENLIKQKKGEACMVTLTRKRIKNNLNMFCIFTGKLGAGKSWSGISYAQQLDPDFDVDKQVTFNFRKTMELINSEWFKEKKIRIILWDEPQITISNRAWQSQVNRLVNYLISTFRHQNIILIMAAPYKDFLDSQTMKLLHWEFQCSSIDKKNGVCTVYPKYQQYNPTKKITYPHPLYVLRNKGRILMRTWKIRKPNKEAINIYEPNKLKFTATLNKTIQETLDKLEKVKDEPRSILDTGTMRSREIKRKLVKNGGDIKKTAKEDGTSIQNIYKIIGGREKVVDLRAIDPKTLGNGGF